MNLNEEKLSVCKKIQVSIRLESALDDLAQFFYLPKGQSGFSEANSQTLSTKANNKQTLNFIYTSPTGFESKLRIDPVANSKSVKLHNLEIFCLSLK